MHLFQTKFWNQLIRIWHRWISQEIAMGFNIWTVISLNYGTPNWKVTIFFLWNVNNCLQLTREFNSFVERWPPEQLRCNVPQEVWYQDTGEATGEQLAMYLQQSSCIILNFQSVTKRPNKTPLQIKQMRKVFRYSPHHVLKTGTKPQNYIE